MANTTDCAWCLKDRNEEPEEQSHGVCEPHAEQILVGFYQNKFDAVPSYFERFQRDAEAEAGSAA